MTRACLVVGLVAAGCGATQRPAAERVMASFRDVTARELWPGFRPREVPVAIFDGKDTWLYQHAAPPPGFRPIRPGVARFAGRHETMRANTGTEVGGVRTATVTLDAAASPRTAAALVVHEIFHVFESVHHPAWVANEFDALIAPDADVDAVALTLREDAALASARDLGTACAAAEAVARRRERAARLPAAVSAYIRGVERNEGLAQYVEDRAFGRPRPWPRAPFPPEELRKRAYFSGQSWALLLDRHAAGWQARADSAPLDELLAMALAETAPCPAAADPSLAARAQAGVADLVTRRAAREEKLLGAPGPRLVVEAGAEPLGPQGFDPWNLERLSAGRLAHLRWIKLGNGAGVVEVLDRASVTEGAGAHPLANGVRRLVVTGLPAAPTVTRSGDEVVIEGQGVSGRFRGATARTAGAEVVITLAQ